jgi:phosphohistidine phosphatase
MELFLLRHGIATQRTFRDDSERPLTPEGIKKMRAIAKGMRRLGLEFDLILSSPYLRARQTAEIAAAELRAKKRLKLSEHLAATGKPSALISELSASHRSCKSVLLVGHEPYLSQLISALLSGKPHLAIEMKKGGLCKLTVESLRYGACARLEWLLTAKQMTRIGKA